MIKIILDEALKKYGITRYELSKKTGISFPVIDHYYKNKVIRYDSYVLNKICNALECELYDIIKYEKD